MILLEYAEKMYIPALKQDVNLNDLRSFKITTFIYASKLSENGKTMYVLYYKNDGDVEDEKIIIKSNNWKDIWDKLNVIDKNNILKHNNFPLINN